MKKHILAEYVFKFLWKMISQINIENNFKTNYSE